MPVRFRIERPRGLFPGFDYRVCVQDQVIIVRAVKSFLDRRAIAWKWVDGTDYAWLRPMGPKGQFLQLVSGERLICSGECFVAWASLNRAERVVTLAQWHVGGQTLVLRGGRICCRSFPCTLSLWELDGRRLASWVGGRLEGVLREDLSQELHPVVIGIIVATLHGFW